LIIHSCSHIGRVRDKNEDTVYADISLGLAAIADGIGGQKDGEIASSTAISLLAEEVAKNGAFSLDVLKGGFFRANHTIYTMNRENGSEKAMGTTMTAALFNENEVLLVHVGDTRAYLFNQDGFIRLSDDHSVVGELIRDGNITPQQAASHIQRNVLTRYVGGGPLVKIDELSMPWNYGDYLLLCSDGLYSLVEEEELLKTVINGASIALSCEELVNLALRRGGFDNISVILVCNSRAVV
jgi:protein phosphatase